MAAYYNENNREAAAWLRELIKAKVIADGYVDERDVRDVCPRDLDGFVQCHFFAGIGVWSYALRLAGWSDDRPVWTGSCPCQPFSQTGRKGRFADQRHLWPHWFHLVALCRPVEIFGEQVASEDGLAWADLVQADLEAAQFSFGVVDLCAAGFRAPHIRQRLYWVANANGAGPQGRDVSSIERGAERTSWSSGVAVRGRDGRKRLIEPGSFPLAHGAPARVGRLRGYGNAIVADAAAAFIKAYLECVT